MSPLPKRSPQPTSSTAGLYVVIGIIVCICFTSPILLYLKTRRDAQQKTLKTKAARLSTAETSARTATESQRNTQRELTREQNRANDLQTQTEQLRTQKRGVETRLTETQAVVLGLEREVDRAKGELERQGNTVVELQAEVLGLEEEVRKREERVKELQRKWDFVNQQFAMSQANSPQTSPLSVAGRRR